MYFRPHFVISAALIAAVPAISAAQTGVPEVEGNDRVERAAMTPLRDLNLDRDEIPPKLLAVQVDPYSLNGIRTCQQIGAEVEQLDAILGPDVDSLPTGSKDVGSGAIETAGSVLGGFLLPFRGVLRQLSGANAARDRYLTAIYAGTTRRSFMKGMGQARRCKGAARPIPYAERPATVAAAEEETARLNAEQAKALEKQIKAAERTNEDQAEALEKQRKETGKAARDNR